MNLIRPATEAEIASIRDRADIQPTSLVVALDTPQGAILGVIRWPVELNPVIFPEGLPDRLKYVFVRDVANGLKFKGETSFYFQIPTEDNEAWLKVVKTFGAEQVSPVPEFRMKKVLFPAAEDAYGVKEPANGHN